MNKVYMIIETYSELEEDTIAVFSTKEKASLFVSEKKKLSKSSSLHIREMVLDEKEIMK